MTEEEWLACDDPRPRIGHLRTALSVRKARLFAIACCRLLNPQSKQSEQAILIAEKYADLLVSDDERSVAYSDWIQDTDRPATHEESWWGFTAIEHVLTGPADPSWYGIAAFICRAIVHAMPLSIPSQLTLLQCTVGNPFRPVAFDPNWRTSTVVSIAQSMYESREFAPMPVLADALQDAGCEQPDILDHCRTGQIHVRGCWVVDLILGKE